MRQAIMTQTLNSFSTQRKRKEVMPWLPDKDYLKVKLPPTKLQEKYLSELNEYFETENPKGEYVLIIAGDKETKKQPLTFEEAVLSAKELADKGMSVNEAAKTVAAETGFKKSDIYKSLL